MVYLVFETCYLGSRPLTTLIDPSNKLHNDFDPTYNDMSFFIHNNINTKFLTQNLYRLFSTTNDIFYGKSFTSINEQPRW